MQDDMKSAILLRYGILATELLLVNLLTWFFYVIGLFEATTHHLVVQNMATTTLCYAVCNIGSGVVTHQTWSRADQVMRHTLTNWVTFGILQLVLNAVLQFPMRPLYVFTFYYGGILILSFLNRICWRRCIQVWRRVESHVHKVAFVGSLDNAMGLLNAMSNKTSGYRVLGYFADAPDLECERKGVAYLGLPAEAALWVTQHEGELHQLYCTLPATRSEGAPLMRACENHLVRFHVIPSELSYMHHRMNFEVINNVPVLGMRNEPLEFVGNRMVKRMFDLVCSGIFLCTLFPIIYIIIGIAIKASSPGPVFFKQKRSGQNGREFWCYKFRSMKVNAQADSLQATQHDPRKTRIGEFIRHTNIDELPQFINVFKGEMSMVGPRPHMLKHTEEYSQLIDKYMVRHFAKPGITGWAQVTGFRGETRELWQMEGRVQKDIWYIEHWTFALDLYIMYKTFANVIAGEKEAY